MPVRAHRRRYLGFTVEGLNNLDDKIIGDTLFDAVSKYQGVKGLSMANLKLIEFNPENNFGIVRCSNTYIREVQASIALIDNIMGKLACIHVDRVSGTIRALRDKTKSKP